MKIPSLITDTNKIDSNSLLQIYNIFKINKHVLMDEIYRSTSLPTSKVLQIINEIIKRKLVTKFEKALILKTHSNLEWLKVISEDNIRKKYEKERFEVMKNFAETKGCRKTIQLNYFGEINTDKINLMCDNDYNNLNSAFPLSNRNKVNVPQSIARIE